MEKVFLSLSCHPELVKRLDACRRRWEETEGHVSRSAVIRRLLQMGLEVEAKLREPSGDA